MSRYTKQEFVVRRPGVIVHESITVKRVLALACEAMKLEKILGLCIRCGVEHEVGDVDARAYRCAACSAMTVYSAEDLVLRLTP